MARPKQSLTPTLYELDAAELADETTAAAVSHLFTLARAMAPHKMPAWAYELSGQTIAPGQGKTQLPRVWQTVFDLVSWAQDGAPELAAGWITHAGPLLVLLDRPVGELGEGFPLAEQTTDLDRMPDSLAGRLGVLFCALEARDKLSRHAPMTARDIAALSGRTLGAVRRLQREGKLTFRQHQGELVLPGHDARDWIEANRSQKTPARTRAANE